MILIALIICIVIMAGSLTWGYWLAGYEEAARCIILFGILWIIAQWRRWKWFSAPAVFLALLLAAYGIWFEFHPSWMFNGASFAVFAWNLIDLQQRLKLLSPREDVRGITRRHVLRIGLLAVASIFITILLVMLWGD